jgi:hypothetical protein
MQVFLPTVGRGDRKIYFERRSLLCVGRSATKVLSCAIAGVTGAIEG